MKGDKGRQGETRGDKGRQGETRGDKGRQGETRGDKGDKVEGTCPDEPVYLKRIKNPYSKLLGE